MNYTSEHKPIYFLHPDDLRALMENYDYTVDFVGPPRLFYSITTAGTQKSPDNPLVLNSYVHTTRIIEFLETCSADGTLAVQVDIHFECDEFRFVSPTLVPFRLERKHPVKTAPVITPNPASATLPHSNCPPSLERNRHWRALPPRNTVMVEPSPFQNCNHDSVPVPNWTPQIANQPPRRKGIIYPEQKGIGYSNPKLLPE